MDHAVKNNADRKIFYIIIGFSLFDLLLHFYTNAFASYGFFRDELYYLACAKHLDIGYVDQPPLSIYILALSKAVFGESLFALRLIPAIVSALTIYFIGKIVLEFNGGSTAVIAALVSVVLCPVFLGMNTFYSMNTFVWFFWSLAFYFIIRLIKTDDKKYWLPLGLVAGLALLNKIDFLWFGAGLALGMIFTPERKYFRMKEPYIAAATALIIFSPFIVWNFTHNFAHIEFIRNATSLKYSSTTRLDFVITLLKDNGPSTFPVMLAGIYFLFFHTEGKKFRLGGYIFLITFLILIINEHSKAEYLSPLSTLLFPAGGIIVEKLSLIKNLRWLKYAVPAFLFIGGVFLIPLALPIMPVQKFIQYEKLLGIKSASSEAHKLNDLPQFYADMFGWKNMASSVSKVYTTLSPKEQKHTVVFARNYGEAGAIDFYRKYFPLPPVICPHNSYWYWNDCDTTKNILIIIGGSKTDNQKYLNFVREAGVIQSKYSIPYENNLTIFIGWGLKVPIKVIWNRIRFFI